MYKDYENEEECENPSEQKNVMYTTVTAMNFLQSEMKKFQVKSLEWEIEKTQLQAQISFLLGERKGQSNIRNDLVARIKILEQSLKKSRLNNLENIEQPDPNSVDLSFRCPQMEDQLEIGIPQYDDFDGNWAQGRDTLRKYLNEFEFGDKLTDIMGRNSQFEDSTRSKKLSASSNIHIKDEGSSTNPSYEKDVCDELLDICDEFDDYNNSKDDEVPPDEFESTVHFMKEEVHSLLSDVSLDSTINVRPDEDCEESDESDNGDQSMDLDEDQIPTSRYSEICPFRRVGGYKQDLSRLRLIGRDSFDNIVRFHQNSKGFELDFQILEDLEMAQSLFVTHVGELPTRIVFTEGGFVGATEAGVLHFWINYDSEHTSDIGMCDVGIVCLINFIEDIVVLTKKNTLLCYSLPGFELVNKTVFTMESDHLFLAKDISIDCNEVLVCTQNGRFVVLNPTNCCSDFSESDLFCSPNISEFDVVSAVAMDSDFETLIMGFESGIIRVFSIFSGFGLYRTELIYNVHGISLNAHEGAITSLCHSNLNTLLSTCSDGCVRLWDMGNVNWPCLGEDIIENVRDVFVKPTKDMIFNFVLACSDTNVFFYESDTKGSKSSFEDSLEI